jgi:sRNA-binding regulator protein Hfq
MCFFRVIICFFCLFFGFESFAQKQEDVIYLKNGWILRGEITAKNQETITIKTQDRNVFVFKIDEILNTNKQKHRLLLSFCQCDEKMLS